VSDPDIDAVYIPLPNGLHHRWALAALRNAKHVLIEKPMASNAREAREIRDAASAAGKVALEAFHWRFHPAAHTVKSMVLSGKYGPVRSVNAAMVFPAGVLGEDDIRFQYSLRGGGSMDLTYVYSAAAYFAVRDVASDETEFEVLDAKPRLNKKDKLVDDAMRATIPFKESPDNNNNSSSSSAGGLGFKTQTKTETKAVTSADLTFPELLGLIPRMWATAMDVTIHCEKAEVLFTNFVGPWLSHTIAVTPVTRDDRGKVTSRATRQSKTQKCYKGGPLWERERAKDGAADGDDNDEKVVGADWWTTYRYQLEGFVREIRETESGGWYQYKGPFVSLDKSVRTMEIIDAVYEKADLPARGQ
jgi:predicted dehydrogenase